MNRSDVRTILETSLYRPVKAFLEGLGFVVKGEVRDCDLVALKGDDLPVVVILAAIAKPRRLDRRNLQAAAQLVDDKRRQGFAFDIFGGRLEDRRGRAQGDLAVEQGSWGYPRTSLKVTAPPRGMADPFPCRTNGGTSPKFRRNMPDIVTGLNLGQGCQMP
jgi:hypothetical protein